MLASYSLLLLLSMRGGMARAASSTLDISARPNDKMTKEFTELDSVSYALYKPMDGSKFTKVVDGRETVWDGEQFYDSAKAVLVALDRGVPTLLYVHTDLFSHYNNVYARKNTRWVRTTLEAYTARLDKLRQAAGAKPFTLNLKSNKSTDKFKCDPTNNFKWYESFVPLAGHVATSVYYNVSNLWTAKTAGERAVAAWSYKRDEVHYLVRVLVSNSANEYRFYNFFRVKNVWVDLDESQFSFLKADHGVFPPEFLFPHFLKVSAKPAAFVVMPGDKDGSRLLSSFSQKAAEVTKVETTKENYDFKYHNATIPFRSCSKLDFSKRVPGSVGNTLNSVFDQNLSLLTYLPKSGKFFSRVSDGEKVIYQRNLDTEACVGVHFYSKGKVPALADVLVASPHQPRSEYHMKESGQWHPITKERFLDLLEGLKA